MMKKDHAESKERKFNRKYMFRNVFIHLNDWDEFFGEENETQKEQIYIFGSESSRRSYGKGRVYVINSVFEDLEEQERGGGIYFNSTDANSKLLVEDSQFVNCVTHLSGGGIYRVENGSTVLHRVCGFGCKVTEGSENGNDGPFSTVHSSTGCYNYIIESQVSLCNSSWGCTVHMMNGNCMAKYQNISYNNCARYSGIKYSTNDVCNTSYSSLKNNTLDYDGVFGIDYSKEAKLISSNIIYNIKTGNNEGLIKVWICQLEIRDTCIYGNVNKLPTFFALDASSMITVYNCTVDDKSSNIEINTNNILPSPNSFFNMLKLMNTGKCYGTFDIVEGITFELPTPEPTQSQTPKHCINALTCKHTNKKLLFHIGIFHILITGIKYV